MPMLDLEVIYFLKYQKIVNKNYKYFISLLLYM